MKKVMNFKWSDDMGDVRYRMVRLLAQGRSYSTEIRVPGTFSRQLKANLIRQMRADFREELAQLALKPNRS